MKKTQLAFVVLLFLSALVTAGLGARTLLDPQGMMTTFGVEVSEVPGLDLLTAVLGGVLLSLSLFVLVSAVWSYQGRREGRFLGMVAAGTLLLVAACAYFVGGSTEILLLDGVRGTVLLVLGWLWTPDD